VRGLFLQFDVLTLIGMILIILVSTPVLIIVTDLFSQSLRVGLLINNLRELVKLISLFYYILLMNRCGLILYTFPATAYLYIFAVILPLYILLAKKGKKEKETTTPSDSTKYDPSTDPNSKYQGKTILRARDILRGEYWEKVKGDPQKISEYDDHINRAFGNR